MSARPKKTVGALLGALLGTLALATAAQAAPDEFTLIERGRALATAGDCVACHTAPGGAPFAGGLGIETPFGNIVSANITPDVVTGIGTWTDDDFAKAMAHGQRPDGTQLYPAFPYIYYTKMPRGDVDAIHAYLRTLPAVSNDVDRNTLPFPFNIRMAMKAWNFLYFTPGVFKPDPQKSTEFNRGAYLVEGPAHCGACHTAKTMLGGDNSSASLQGGDLQGWFAPNITGAKRVGLGDWSTDEIVSYLGTGVNVHSSASGPMAEVITNSTSKMPQADLHAIAVYLKERAAPAAAAAQPVAANDARMQSGAAVFADNCSACHNRKGEGIAGIFPSLAGSALIQQDNPTTLARVVIQGSQAVGTDAVPTRPSMPSLGWRLNDAQISDVLTYIRNSWGNAAPAVTADQVSKVRGLVAGNP